MSVAIARRRRSHESQPRPHKVIRHEGHSRSWKGVDFFRVRLVEAATATIDAEQRTAEVVIITEGLGNLRDRNLYMASAVESSVTAFEGKQFFIDHPTKTEDEDRPERSVRDLAGFFFNCRAGATLDPDTGEQLAACYATLKFAESTPGQLAFDQVRTALDYQRQFPHSKDVYCGISINAGGVSHPGRVDGMPVNIVTEIREAFSADIVTKPARGGRFLAQSRESVASGSALSARVAAWHREHGRHQPHRARIALHEGDTMITKPVVKFTEAQIKRLVQRAIKAREGGSLPRAFTAEGAGRLAEKLKAYGALQSEDGAGDLLNDIKQDLAELSGTLDGGGGGAPEKKPPVAGGGAPEADEGEDGEAEDDEAEGGEAEDDEADEGEDDGEGEGNTNLGMGGEEEDDEDDTGAPTDQPMAMNYTCEGCGKENEVLPPKGFSLRKVGATESRRPARRREARVPAGTTPQAEQIIRRMAKQIEAKEARFQTANAKMRGVLRESFKLRARLQFIEALQRAATAIRKAELKGVMRPEELVEFHESQWPLLIRREKRTQQLALSGVQPLPRAGTTGMRETAGGGGGSASSPGEDFLKRYNDHSRR